MPETRPEIFHYDIVVAPEVIDVNRHVNNVAYVQWMQEVAVRHSHATGATKIARESGGTWVARSHHIVYRQPAFEGERIRLSTWVRGFRKARSWRRYEFVRLDDNILLADGETEWVFVDATTGRPKSLPLAVSDCFVVVDVGAPRDR